MHSSMMYIIIEVQLTYYWSIYVYRYTGIYIVLLKMWNINKVWKILFSQSFLMTKVTFYFQHE